MTEAEWDRVQRESERLRPKEKAQTQMRLETVRTGTAPVLKRRQQLTEMDADILPTVRGTKQRHKGKRLKHTQGPELCAETQEGKTQSGVEPDYAGFWGKQRGQKLAKNRAPGKCLFILLCLPESF